METPPLESNYRTDSLAICQAWFSSSSSYLKVRDELNGFLRFLCALFICGSRCA